MPAGTMERGALGDLLERLLGTAGAERLQRVLVVPESLWREREATRAVVAQALNMLLFADLLERVPAAELYVFRAEGNGRTVLHDHGAVRTVRARAGVMAGDGAINGAEAGAPAASQAKSLSQVASEDKGGKWGALPAGEEGIARLLRPLGYALHGVYPLERLKMTGRSYAHVDMPEEMAQFFVSELHVERFSSEFQATAARVLGTSVDPLTEEAQGLLAKLEQAGKLEIDEAARLLPVLVGCFGRQHGEIAEADYEALLGESAEMAWIATEGNAFNHVTDRVEDVDALAAEQKALGEAIKPTVERSQSGRVRQTALVAARVRRQFRAGSGELVEREVPGSFLEFITRLTVEEDGKLDLSFDSSNAQAIFKMTASS